MTPPRAKRERRAWERRTPEPKPGHVAAIRDAGVALAAAERAVFVAVCRARQDAIERYWASYPGATWEDIGDALGISKQAAAKRFSGWRYDEATDQLICERPLPR